MKKKIFTFYKILTLTLKKGKADGQPAVLGLSQYLSFDYSYSYYKFKVAVMA